MSPGVTFERVYHELKRRLADGTLRPGQPIEPAVMSAELAASITPIRDALHRLVGERLVEAPNHNGFQVPRPTEAELRDLYAWNGRVLELAIREIRIEAFDSIDSAPAHIETGETAAGLFLWLAGMTGSEEHTQTVHRLNDRLASCRRAEARVLDDLTGELDAIGHLLKTADRTRSRRALLRYHRRRIAAAPDIIVTLTGKD